MGSKTAQRWVWPYSPVQMTYFHKTNSTQHACTVGPVALSCRQLVDHLDQYERFESHRPSATKFIGDYIIRRHSSNKHIYCVWDISYMYGVSWRKGNHFYYYKIDHARWRKLQNVQDNLEQRPCTYTSLAHIRRLGFLFGTHLISETYVAAELTRARTVHACSGFHPPPC